MVDAWKLRVASCNPKIATGAVRAFDFRFRLEGSRQGRDFTANCFACRLGVKLRFGQFRGFSLVYDHKA